MGPVRWQFYKIKNYLYTQNYGRILKPILKYLVLIHNNPINSIVFLISHTV